MPVDSVSIRASWFMFLVLPGLISESIIFTVVNDTMKIHLFL